MQSFVLVAAACLVLSGSCLAQNESPEPSSTKCDKKVIEDFKADAYMGEWFEQRKMGNMSYEQGGECVSANYTALPAGSKFNVTNSMVKQSDHSWSNRTGVASFTSNANTAKLNVQFGNSTRVGAYWVLSTDYTNYTIVYSCEEMSGTKLEKSWILTRSRNPSNDTLNKVKEMLNATGLAWDNFTATRQDEEACRVAGSAAPRAASALVTLLSALLVLGRLL